MAPLGHFPREIENGIALAILTVVVEAPVRRMKTMPTTLPETELPWVRALLLLLWVVLVVGGIAQSNL